MFKHFIKASLFLIFLAGSSFAVVPKNIILLIGDGMGPEQVKAAGMYAHGAAGTLSFESLPYQAQCMTYSANSSITDSAAAATAIATGQKVNNDVISVALPGDGHELFTMLEYFKAKGKSTGLVTTVYVSHATPAGFGAHETSRNNFTNIANDYLTQTKPNVLMGGALYVTSPAAMAAGYTVVTDRTTMQALNTNLITYLSGQFGSGEMPYEYDGLGSLPHLSEMTATALDVLDNDSDGFFLMVEGGKIDKAGHSNDLPRNIGETIEFSNSVQVVLDWAAGRTDTLVIVTADHETGGLTVVANNGQGVYPTVIWSTTGHTGVNVPVYAQGVNADKVTGTLDNTNFFGIVVNPGVVINSPATGSAVFYGEPVTLSGTAFGTPPYTYTWESDVDGYLGSGVSLAVSDLSVHQVGGVIQPHTITLTMQDASLDTNTAQIELTVVFKADFEPDADVDLEDFAVIAANWGVGGADPTPNAGWWKLDEISGTMAADATGNGNTGTLFNMDNSDWVTGYFDKAMDFDGVNDYVQILDSDSVSVGNGSFTISAWIYPHSITGDHAIVSKVKDSNEKEYFLSIDDGGYLQFELERGSNNGKAKTTIPVITTNTWQKVMVTYNVSTYEIILYLNGVPQASSSTIGGPSNSLSDHLYIGALGGTYINTSGSKWFDGLIDDVRIYNYIITAQTNVADLTKDGTVSIGDLMELVEDWLASGI